VRVSRPSQPVHDIFPRHDDAAGWAALWIVLQHIVREASLHDPAGRLFELTYLGDHLLPPHIPSDISTRAAS
jgi:hypothetical protein